VRCAGRVDHANRTAQKDDTEVGKKQGGNGDGRGVAAVARPAAKEETDHDGLHGCLLKLKGRELAEARHRRGKDEGVSVCKCPAPGVANNVVAMGIKKNRPSFRRSPKGTSYLWILIGGEKGPGTVQGRSGSLWGKLNT